jgi:formimidoylglutamate deiminase
VLDDTSPLLAGRDASNAIDTWIFAGSANLVRSVVVAGETVVDGFRHRGEDRIAARYGETVRRLAASA